MRKSSKLFVGMDVHKDSIDVATGDEAGGEVRLYGAVGGDRAAMSRLVAAQKRQRPFVFQNERKTNLGIGFAGVEDGTFG